MKNYEAECKGCHYWRSAGICNACHYLLVEGKSRGCKPGNDCIKRKPIDEGLRRKEMERYLLEAALFDAEERRELCRT